MPRYREDDTHLHLTARDREELEELYQLELEADPALRGVVLDAEGATLWADTLDEWDLVELDDTDADEWVWHRPVAC